MDSGGKVCCDSRVGTADELVARLGVYMYHYSYVFEEGVKSKADYYSRMGWGGGCEGGSKWAATAWARLANPLRVHLIDFPPSWIVAFKGEHPAAVAAADPGSHLQENPMIAEFLDNRGEQFARIGEYICNICRDIENKRVNKYKAAGLVLKQLMLPTDSQLLEADFTIFKSALKLLGA